MSVEGRPSGRASMAVPERIVYQGRDSYALKASPRELHLEPQMNQDSTFKMNTPPRTITLANSMTSLHRTDSNGSLQLSTEDEDDMTLVVNDRIYEPAGTPVTVKKTVRIENSHTTHPVRNHVDPRVQESVVQDYDEDIQELRQQLNRVTRRMLVLEEEMVDRKRERYYFALATLLGFAAMQAITWMKNGNYR